MGSASHAVIERLMGSGGDDRFIISGDDPLHIDGGDDMDEISFANASRPISINLNLGVAAPGPIGSSTVLNIENATGAPHNDRITGDAERNVLKGLNGHDIIVGGGGSDQIWGGPGSDTALYGYDEDPQVYAVAQTGSARADYFIVKTTNGTDTLREVEFLQVGAGEKIALGLIPAINPEFRDGPVAIEPEPIVSISDFFL